MNLSALSDSFITLFELNYMRMNAKKIFIEILLELWLDQLFPMYHHGYPQNLWIRSCGWWIDD